MYRAIHDNLSAVAREVNVPIGTLRRWVQLGKLTLPEDFELAKSATKIGGRWYLQQRKDKQCIK